jgi:hypothetical protein
VLAAQRASGVLAGHEGVVDQRRLDLAGDATDWPDPGSFDVILATYVLDSLPFDLLTIRDDTVWRKEMRTVLDVPPARPADLAALRAALARGRSAGARPPRLARPAHRGAGAPRGGGPRRPAPRRRPCPSTPAARRCPSCIATARWIAWIARRGC